MRGPDLKPRRRRPSMPLDARAARFYAPSAGDGCWEWTGCRNAAGYGTIQVTDPAGVRRSMKAHRLVYELLVGPIPDGLELDHTCVNPPCVNPAHLDPVTHAENQRRRAERTGQCPKGHPYTRGEPGDRRCLTCLKESRRRTMPRQLSWSYRRRRELRGPDAPGPVCCQCGAEFSTPRGLRLHCTRRGHEPAGYVPAQRADYLARRGRAA